MFPGTSTTTFDTNHVDIPGEVTVNVVLETLGDSPALEEEVEEEEDGVADDDSGVADKDGEEAD